MAERGRWEYEHFTAETGRVNEQRWRNMQTGEYLPEPEKPEDAGTRLARLGAEGWELVAVHPVPTLSHMYANVYLYVLKRPGEEAS